MAAAHCLAGHRGVYTGVIEGVSQNGSVTFGPVQGEDIKKTDRRVRTSSEIRELDMVNGYRKNLG